MQPMAGRVPCGRAGSTIQSPAGSVKLCNSLYASPKRSLQQAKYSCIVAPYGTGSSPRLDILCSPSANLGLLWFMPAEGVVNLMMARRRRKPRGVWRLLMWWHRRLLRCGIVYDLIQHLGKRSWVVKGDQLSSMQFLRLMACMKSYLCMLRKLLLWIMFVKL